MGTWLKNLLKNSLVDLFSIRINSSRENTQVKVTVTFYSVSVYPNWYYSRRFHCYLLFTGNANDTHRKRCFASQVKPYTQCRAYFMIWNCFLFP